MGSKPKRTQTYSREADWLGTLDDAMRDTMLGFLEKQRHTIVEEARSGKADADLYYNVQRLILDELIPDHSYPDPDVFANFPEDAKARVIQRALTDLSQRLDKVVIPPPPGGGGGGGGNGGGGGGGGGTGPSQSPGGRPATPQKSNAGDGASSEKPKQPPTKPPLPPPPPQAAQPTTPKEENGNAASGNPLSDFGLEDDAAPDFDLDTAFGTNLRTDDDLLKRGLTYEDLTESAYAAGAGGEQHLSSQRDAGIFYAVRDLVNKIAFDVDFSHTVPEGTERWSLPRVFKSAFNVNYLRDAKQDYGVTVENIYLSLDTSGSVEHMAPTIASLAGGSAGIVHLYHGTEGRPEYKILRDEPLKYPGQPFPEWDDGDTHPLKFDPHYNGDHETILPEFRAFAQDFQDRYGTFYPEIQRAGFWGGQSFEVDFAWWLHLEQPPPGSFLLFWGDTEGLGVMAPRLLKSLLRPYKFAWLYPYSEKHAIEKAGRNPYGSQQRWRWEAGTVPPDEMLLDDPMAFTSVEVFKFAALGLPVFYGVKDAATLRAMFQRIQTLKGGMN